MLVGTEYVFLHLSLLCGHFLTFQSFQSMLHHVDMFDAYGNSCLINILSLFIYKPCLWSGFWDHLFFGRITVSTIF